MSNETAHKVILLVEDNPDDRELTLFAFKEANVPNQVVTCADGENSYVRKPVDFSRFIEVSRQLGLYWLALNEAPSAHA